VTAPSFSIVIPTYERPDQLETCLAAIAALDYDRSGVEVIVVDDGTEPASRVEEAVERSIGALSVRVVRHRHAGPAAARNLGARHARLEFLAFTDDDCAPEPGWLGALARTFVANRRCVAGGRTVNAVPDDPFASASQTLLTYLQGHWRGAGRPFFPSNNLAVSRRAFESLGGFDEGFPLAAGEDREFCDRCLHAGLELVDVEDAVVRHLHRMSLRRFLRQQFNYGRGALVYRRMRAERAGSRMRLEAPSFYCNLLRHPFRERTQPGPWKVALLLGASQGAIATGFLLEGIRGWRRRRDRGDRGAAAHRPSPGEPVRGSEAGTSDSVRRGGTDAE